MKKNSITSDSANESVLILPSDLPDGYVPTVGDGLSEAEAKKRLEAGEGNAVSESDEKSFRQILLSNTFTFFNMVNLALAVCLLLVGSYRNMLFMVIVIANILIGSVQELRARKTIRELKVLNTPSVHVLRDGKETVCRSDECVRGDLAVFRAGDQVIADCIVTNGEGSAMESLLTGESDAVPKKTDSWLYSGSYITEGKLIAQLVYVAQESYAGRLTREARKTVRPHSVLMTELNRLIRIDSILLIPLGILLFLKQILISHAEMSAAVASSVGAMLGMIPEGLVLLTSIAMALGVIKLGKKHTLIQELSGIETLARVDVLCLDKTGTITSGNMRLAGAEECEAAPEEMKAALARIIGALDDHSPTMNAIRSAIVPGNETPCAVLPFSSSRKKSAASFDDGITLILGAPQFVLDDDFDSALKQRVKDHAAKGCRVLVLAEARGVLDGENVPPVCRVLGLCMLTDEIREGARETLQYFRDQDVQLKVISGDDPVTVSVIAGKAGLTDPDRYVDATTLKTQQDIEDACEKYTVFGRVTPMQKKQLVIALREKGHSVAMTGDGVNDIPAMKAADCSIAMAGGSDAARHAAQVTLLRSDFSVMPQIVLEGRRVINNITRAASLFLTKTLFSFFLSVLTLCLGDYPFEPIQMTLVSSLTVGMPGFLLAFEPSMERVQGSFLKTVFLRALPGGVAVALCSAAAMMLMGIWGWEREICSAISTIIAGIVGIVVLLRASLPFSRLRAAVVSLSAAAFAGALLILGGFFKVDISRMDGNAWIVLGVLAVCACLLIFLTDMAVRLTEKAGIGKPTGSERT